MARKNKGPGRGGGAPPQNILPCIWAYAPVYFPGADLKISVKKNQELIERLTESPYIIVANVREEAQEDADENFLQVSILAKVLRFSEQNSALIIDLRLKKRIAIVGWPTANILRLAEWEDVYEEKPTEENMQNPEVTAKILKLIEAPARIRELPPRMPSDWFSKGSLNSTIDLLAYLLNLRRSSRVITRLHEILEELNIIKRLDLLVKLLDDMAALPDNFKPDHPAAQTKTPDTPSGASENSPQKRYEQIKDKLPEEARKEIEKELARLRRGMHPSEASMTMDHLDLLLWLPWEVYTEDTKDLREVKKSLDEDHWGLEDVKERILEFLAVRQLNPSAKSPILCFVGPPGVGKTSLGQSIAHALGRKFASLALGGMRDEAEIRGHGGTYINAKPGKIIEELLRCGSANPVFMLDEIDKVGQDWRGDPAAALLEALDPEQNHRFYDRYLNVRFNLSRVLFITTANIVDTIVPALIDRMEIIELPGYTPLEKLKIAQQHLIKRRRKENGFPVKLEDGSFVDLNFSDGAVLKLIHQYTQEAGVRNLEREIDEPFRKIAKEILMGEIPSQHTVDITKQNLHIYCGNPPLVERQVPDTLPPGVVPILAVSDAGGHVFEAEVEKGFHAGGRKITITGVRESLESKESVNKIEESLKIAFDALTMCGRILFERTRELEQDGPLFVRGNITNGGIPKDGPSAGVSLWLATYGALTGQSVKPTKDTPLLAATGEITLNLNMVRVIGGIRDKILAAHRYGIKKLIIPKDNEPELEDVPREILDEVEIIPVQSMLEALAVAYPDDQRIKKYIEKAQQGS
ncbi:MAG: AAA family ATPase [Candidatus Sungiibacteriota bacterium]|uniref:Lon protease n=1 Tax=Candidatus Sungiibacteriota bacterium TaxID=2750080 RepID=A0A7T5UQZ4_9BACT|nr:MAG: AAA family ATPase [Candidatus Sungbacteria bacterium]